ncbi:hypothetical protein ACSBR2_024120 [Camellia fascicularis]
MAKETIDIPETPEKIELEGDNTRRYSTGNLIISKNEVKVLPRYLSDSMSSCHDLCKYGINTSIEKARSLTPKRITARSCEGQDHVKDVNLQERKKKSVINPKHLPDSKSQTTDKHQVIAKVAPTSAKKVTVSSKRFSLPGARMDVSAKHATDLRPKPVQSKAPSFLTAGHLSSGRYSNTSKDTRMPKFGKIKDLVPPAVSLSLRPSIKGELGAKSGNNKDLNKVSHLKSRSVRKAESKQPVNEEAPEKTIHVIETQADHLTQNGCDTSHSPQSLNPSSGDKKLECGRIGMHSSRSSPSSEKKTLGHNQNGSQATQSYSSSSSSLLSHKNSLRHNAPSSSSSLSLLSSSSYASESVKSNESDPVSEGIGTKIEYQKPNHKVESTSEPRQVERISLEDKVGSPQKLNFRIGKVVDVPSENTSPSRHRFKQRVVLGENQIDKADTEQRSFKKVVAIDELNGSETETMKVVLRQQAVEVEKRRGQQSLLNNVIKETASKLVETRKSKVKALVGAFESLISLQDSKSSATINAS